MKLFKPSVVVSFVLSLSVVSSSALIHQASAADTLSQQVDAWMKSVVGTYALQGDPGCEKAEVQLWPMGGPNDRWNSYNVLMGEQKLKYDMYFTSGGYGTEIEISKNTFSYTHKSVGSFGGNKSRLIVELEKDDAGALTELRVKDQSPGFLGFWKTDKAYSCRR